MFSPDGRQSGPNAPGARVMIWLPVSTIGPSVDDKVRVAGRLDPDLAVRVACKLDGTAVLRPVRKGLEIGIDTTRPCGFHQICTSHSDGTVPVAGWLRVVAWSAPGSLEQWFPALSLLLTRAYTSVCVGIRVRRNLWATVGVADKGNCHRRPSRCD